MSSRLQELRATARLALPLALAQMGMHLMGLVDTAMLGRYSDSALAGAGIGNSLLFTLQVLGMGTLMGMDSLVPQAVGADERARARSLLGAGVRVSVYIGVPLVLVIGASPLVLPVAGVDADVARDATAYVLWRLPAVIPFLLYTTMRSYLQAYNITRPILYAIIVGNIANAFADAVLIYGDDGLAALHLPRVGLPALGITGAALATSIVAIIITIVLFGAVAVLHRDQGDVPPAGAGRTHGLVRRIIELGLPVGLQLLAEVGIFALTSVMAGRLGKIAAASHQVAITLASFSFSVVVGVGAATSVRVGYGVGAQDVPGTRRAGLVGIAFGAACMAVPAIAFLIIPGSLAAVLTNDGHVISTTIPLLFVAAVFQLSDGVQAVAAGALRGAGDTKAPLIANVLGHYAISLPVSIVLAFELDMGVTGLWWGLSSGLTAVALTLTWRFWRTASKPIARA